MYIKANNVIHYLVVRLYGKYLLTSSINLIKTILANSPISYLVNTPPPGHIMSFLPFNLVES